jgi:ParB-like chromosome segregation protein Spo0J
MITQLAPVKLETAPPMSTMFPIDDQLLADITTKMKNEGFHKTKPLLVWENAFATESRLVVLDGHTRLAAAKKAKLDMVWVDLKSFSNVTEAYLAGAGEQSGRRNMNRGEIAMRVVRGLIELKEAGGRLPTEHRLAKALGVSRPTISRAKALVKDGGDDVLALVRDGELSLREAYERVQLAKKHPATADAPRPPVAKPPKPGEPGWPEGVHPPNPKQPSHHLAIAVDQFRHRLEEHPDPEALIGAVEALFALGEGTKTDIVLQDLNLVSDLVAAAVRAGVDPVELINE